MLYRTTMAHAGGAEEQPRHLAQEPTELRERFSLTLDVHIRGCRSNDLRDLEWFGMFSAAADRAAIESAYRRHLAGEEVFLVADANHFPVGQVWVDLTTKRPERTGVIWALRVLPCLQGLGIGTRLIGAAEQAMKARGHATSELGVEKDNPRAQRLYERLGYRVVGENHESDDERGGFWEWIMTKPLV
jgi:ribosomal protein S18 acetylase RimI-like enzyme